jgi:5-methyltetrahydrofolate--homocysteine methyltransferase
MRVKVAVGGAVVTEGFARSIGADGYARDAVECVRLADLLVGGEGKRDEG